MFLQVALDHQHRRRMARVPAGEQGHAFFRRQLLQRLDFGKRGARRFFQEDVLACLQRFTCGFIAVLRRHAQGDGLDGRARAQHLGHALVGGHALDAVVAAGGGDQLEIGIAGNGRGMLVINDLADAGDGELDGCHGVLACYW